MLRLVAVKTRRPAPEPLDIYPDQRRISLLLKWVQAVCMLHGLRVTNFTSSFGDGRALCYLVSAACAGARGLLCAGHPILPSPPRNNKVWMECSV